ncbi:MAG: ABC transporter [Verrucomicrobiaceae bacterium]|jgi:ABC-type Mn2+/Zn2+ transport system permease subunit/Mn-dependent DtxR family transcriptional regulator|nr:ABC transporter [Verrucomicrobiaceae bacterium]
MTPKFRHSPPFLALLIFMFAMPSEAHAAKISELVEVDLGDQFVRFFSLQDAAIRHILLGCLFMGINFGLLGSFVVVRRMALVGDTLSHAVLPGVAVGFLFTMSKEPWAILLGATMAGLLGAATVSWIQRSTRLKQDAALGMVLASFFAVGICLIKMIERIPSVNRSGLDHFFYGQAAALGRADLWMMGGTAVLSTIIVVLLYRPLLATSFDQVFARSIGLPERMLFHLLMLLLALAIVVALQAVGALMVSAMLITPATTAFLLTKRMHVMLCLATGLAIAAGMLGAFLSFVGEGLVSHALPTGPSMALCAGGFFLLAFLFSPHHGLVFRYRRHLSQTRQITVENTLKAIYRAMESDRFKEEGIAVRRLAGDARETFEETMKRLRLLVRDGLATFASARGEVIYLTPEGLQHASRVVRNHRLWELYLTNEADYDADHVHADAEKVEHILGEDQVMELERYLDYPEQDPHGKRIPSLRDTQRLPLRDLAVKEEEVEP